jgi:hypothetical protein
MAEINGGNFCQHRVAIIAILIDGLHDGIVVVERGDDMTQERRVTTEGLKLVFSGSELHDLLRKGIAVAEGTARS